MTEEKVPGEGSVWKLTGLDMDERKFAIAADAVKVTRIPGDIWRLYFAPGTTPSGADLAKRLGISATIVENVVAADHTALVTPTL